MDKNAKFFFASAGFFLVLALGKWAIMIMSMVADREVGSVGTDALVLTGMSLTSLALAKLYGSRQ